MKVYVTIGNSDRKLNDRQWQEYWHETQKVLKECGKVIGEWYRDGPLYTNGCFLYEVPEGNLKVLRKHLSWLTTDFQQDSIGFCAVADTELITPLVTSSATSAGCATNAELARREADHD